MTCPSPPRAHVCALCGTGAAKSPKVGPAAAAPRFRRRARLRTPPTRALTAPSRRNCLSMAAVMQLVDTWTWEHFLFAASERLRLVPSATRAFNAHGAPLPLHSLPRAPAMAPWLGAPPACAERDAGATLGAAGTELRDLALIGDDEIVILSAGEAFRLPPAEATGACTALRVCDAPLTSPSCLEQRTTLSPSVAIASRGFWAWAALAKFS